jgi:hypothetical protein
MLDRIAVILMGLVVLFLAWTIPAPFLLWTIAGSLLLVVRAKTTGPKQLALIAVIMPVFVILRAPLMALVTLATPHTVDAALLGLDFGFGARFYGWLVLHPDFHWILFVSYYDVLPFWISAVMAFSHKPMEMMKRNILAAVAALPIYLLVPAVGPVWIYTSTAPRDCVPSLHFTWAMLAWYYSPRWLRWPSALLVILTGFATIGLGEHYIIDLVAALPFTVAVVAIPLRFKLPTFGGADELLDRV